MGALLVRYLWSSRAFLLVPVALALEVPTYLEGDGIVGATPSTTFEVANGSGFLLVALAAVGGGVLGLTGTAKNDILRALPNRALGVVLIPGLVAGTVLAMTHLAWVVLVACMQRAVPSTSEVLTTLTALTAIGAGGAVGGLAVALVRNWAVPPLLGIAMFAALAVGFGAPWSGLVRLGGAGVPLHGLEVRTSLAALQLLWFGVVVVVAGALTAATLRAGTRVWLPATIVSAVLVVTCARVVVAAGQDRYQLIDEPWVCLGSRPSFCVVDSRREQLSAVLPSLQEAGARWSRMAPEVAPAKYWQRLDLPVAGHHAEFSLRHAYTPQEAAEVVIEGSFGCAEDWAAGSCDAMLSLAERLAEAELPDQARFRADVASLTC